MLVYLMEIELIVIKKNIFLINIRYNISMKIIKSFYVKFSSLVVPQWGMKVL